MMRPYAIEHIENYALKGKEGINTLVDILQNAKVNIKYDGSSFYVGKINGKFVIATKRVFNKTPKYYSSREDILADKGINKDTQALLIDMLPTLKRSMGSITEEGKLIHSDLMFTKNTTKEESEYIAFQPNFLEYRIDKSSPEAGKIREAELGLAVHSKWNFDGTNPPDNVQENIINSDDLEGVYIMPNSVEETPDVDEELIATLLALANRVPDLTLDDQMALRQRLNILLAKGKYPDVEEALQDVDLAISASEAEALDLAHDTAVAARNDLGRRK